jgi:hypothetical protein
LAADVESKSNHQTFPMTPFCVSIPGRTSQLLVSLQHLSQTVLELTGFCPTALGPGDKSFRNLRTSCQKWPFSNWSKGAVRDQSHGNVLANPKTHWNASDGGENPRGSAQADLGKNRQLDPLPRPRMPPRRLRPHRVVKFPWHRIPVRSATIFQKEKRRFFANIGGVVLAVPALAPELANPDSVVLVEYSVGSGTGRQECDLATVGDGRC